ncbi:hypothetical protein AB0E83_17950 [Streptomyces sp. NPDC035033]|uniref:hypothetical protein n=1 Tax=Streptomyces sp. NPDC035033 TaxID=3155368 RepID=UPI0033FA239C
MSASATPGPSSRAPGDRATTAPASGTLAFGRTRAYEDGLEVTVSAPRPFTPSRGAAGHSPGNRAVVLDVKVRNGSGDRIALDGVVVRARDGEGRELSAVFDAEPPPVLGLHGALLPGRQAVASYGFDLPATARSALEVEVKVGFDQDSDFWSGPLP